MDKLRLRFEKAGKAAYISHLDLMRVMQRAFLRADIPLRYSEGFNPHALISIALPLPVGCASRCELMDFRICGETVLAEMPERLNAALPEGIRAVAVYEAQRKITELKWLRAEGRLEYDSRDAAEAAAGIAQLFSRDSIVVTRRTKRGEGEFDLAPHIQNVTAAPQGEGVLLEGIISAQEPTVNPELLVSALRLHRPEIAPDFATFTRIETYDEKMSVFR